MLLYNLEFFQRHRLNEVKRICIDVNNPVIKYKFDGVYNFHNIVI